MSVLGTLALRNLMKSSPAASVEGLDNKATVSAALHDAIRQEAVYHLIVVKAIGMARSGAKDQDVVTDCLNLASKMLDAGECSVGTFQLLSNNLPTVVHAAASKEQTAVNESHIRAMDIADKVLTANTVGYTKDEAETIQAYTVARQECENKAQEVVKLIGSHIKTLVPDMIRRYPDLTRGFALPF